MHDCPKLKAQLHRRCLEAIQQRIDTAREAIETALAAANEETKSSAGDKYETTRAMMQLEQEKNEVQLARALQVKNELLALGPEKACAKAEPGSLVVTDQGTYYLAGGLGKLQLDGATYYSVATDAPAGAALIGKTAGQVATFQGRPMRILHVC